MWTAMFTSPTQGTRLPANSQQNPGFCASIFRKAPGKRILAIGLDTRGTRIAREEKST
jgi:hypothetical protein